MGRGRPGFWGGAVSIPDWVAIDVQGKIAVGDNFNNGIQILNMHGEHVRDTPNHGGVHAIKFASTGAQRPTTNPAVRGHIGTVRNRLPLPVWARFAFGRVSCCQQQQLRNV